MASKPVIIDREADEAFDKATELVEKAGKKMATKSGPKKVTLKKGQAKRSGGRLIFNVTQTVEISVNDLLDDWANYQDYDYDDGDANRPEKPEVKDAQAGVDLLAEIGTSRFGRRGNSDPVYDYLNDNEYLCDPKDYEITVEFVD